MPIKTPLTIEQEDEGEFYLRDAGDLCVAQCYKREEAEEVLRAVNSHRALVIAAMKRGKHAGL